MRFFTPRVPLATPNNRVEFCSAWVLRWGGDTRNAYRVWRVSLRENGY